MLSPVYHEMLAFFVAALLTGVAVKIMDDYVDEDSDYLSRRPNLCRRYGRDITVYGFCSLLAAAAIELPTTIGLFAAAYAVGMGFGGTSIYLSRLSNRGEGALCMAFSIIFAGFSTTAVALSLMIAIQLWDNWLDEGSHKVDLVLAGGCVGFALLVDASLASMVLFAYGVLFTFERWCLPYTS